MYENDVIWYALSKEVTYTYRRKWNWPEWNEVCQSVGIYSIICDTSLYLYLCYVSSKITLNILRLLRIWYLFPKYFFPFLCMFHKWIFFSSRYFKYNSSLSLTENSSKTFRDKILSEDFLHRISSGSLLRVCQSSSLHTIHIEIRYLISYKKIFFFWSLLLAKQNVMCFSRFAISRTSRLACLITRM